MQLASLLAEQEQSKPAVESEDEELDLDALRAQALKSVEPKTTKKRKSTGSTEDGEIVEEVLIFFQISYKLIVLGKKEKA